MIYNNLLEIIGNTPLVRLNKISRNIPAPVYAKLEGLNPGHSAKDRIALHMIEEAERKGQLKPGSILVEATSGNTGFSLAMVAAVKGYKCIFTVTDKISQEKIDMLSCLGAQVIICPKNAKPEDPDSYYETAKRIARETPRGYYVNQNYNLENARTHYLSTGPEIWEETEGKVTHLLCSTGTGGTLSGTAQYLKEQNNNIKIIAVDAYGSVLKKYFETGIYDKNEIKPYRIEGTGKNIIPGNLFFDLIDQFVKVTDESAAHKARKLAKTEGILAGYSSGAVLQALLKIKKQLTTTDLVVLIFADHGAKYLGKIFNDQWMLQQGFYLHGKQKQLPSKVKNQ
ncbi:cysteine synthase family protein [Sphingobacteriales bacterium UPWRP_1]|nr:cystathionine beta-synthase [Sphingobacteriales bacterium TSM_CSM]PSJ73407.1 cysteine synthase family protein [Sphingobacteriales bacterium UPWRP_1]